MRALKSPGSKNGACNSIKLSSDETWVSGYSVINLVKLRSAETAMPHDPFKFGQFATVTDSKLVLLARNAKSES